MSGAHCFDQKLEGVWCHSLLAPSIPTLLQEYQQLLQQLLGPRAGTMLVHHSGGLDSFVNSSRELIKRIQPHHPCIKFINCLMDAQNSAYGCLGLYVGVICSNLLKELLLVMNSCDDGLSPRAVKEATNLLMARVIAYVESKPKNLVNRLDLSNLDQMLALVGTTLGSKNLSLNDEEKQHLKVKIVEAFLAVIPSFDGTGIDAFGDVIITVVEGRSASEARVFDGVLYRERDPNVSVVDTIKQRTMVCHLDITASQLLRQTSDVNSNRFLLKDTYSRTGTQNQLLKNDNDCRVSDCDKPSDSVFGSTHSARVSNRLAFSKYSQNIMYDENTCSTPEALQQPSCIRVVIFNVPLAFKQSETECLKFTGSSSNCQIYDTVMVVKLRELVRRCSVNVIACQKVVSDIIKFELQRDGVLVLERLGTALTDSLQRLTGCVTISDVAGFLPPFEEIDLGSNNATKAGGNTPTNKSNTRDVDALHNGFVGSLTNISVVKISGKTYLQLENHHQGTKPVEVACHKTRLLIDQDVAIKGSQVVTFLLPAMSSVTSESLKAVVEESLQVLRHAAVHPLGAAAGGCFEAALARWITTGGVMKTDSVMTTDRAMATDGVITAEKLPTRHVDHHAHVASSSDIKSEAAGTGKSVDGVLTAVDRLLEDNAEDVVTEGQLTQVARLVAKVFANMSVLLSGGSSASSFDYLIDTQTCHLLREFPHEVTPYPSYSSPSTEGQSCLLRCSCKSSVPTFSSNPNKPYFVDLRSVFEQNPGSRQTPFPLSHYRQNVNIDPGNIKSSDGENVYDGIGSWSCDKIKSLDNNGDRILPSYVFNVTADVLVESYFAKLNAIRLAFEAVVQLLSVDYCVFDR